MLPLESFDVRGGPWDACTVRGSACSGSRYQDLQSGTEGQQIEPKEVPFSVNATPIAWPTEMPEEMPDEKLPCGLFESEAVDLLTRDITPDDYDVLLQLDETIDKPTASKARLASLTSMSATEFLGERCTICLLTFEKEDGVTALSCDHLFHSDCVLKWLSEHSRRCPVCGDEA